MSSHRHQTGSEEFVIDTTTVLQMAEDLDMDNEHETEVETWHTCSIFKCFKTWQNMELKEFVFH